MALDDIDEVIEIERDAFNSAWSAGAYRRELLDNRIGRYIVIRELPAKAGEVSPEAAQEFARSGLQRLVEGLRQLVGGAQEATPTKGRIVGYAGMWLMVDEAHLTTIAVRRQYRGRGFGELLLIKMLEIAKHLGARVMTLEVRVSNNIAQSLYRKYGFKVAGLRKRYYTDNNEDALIMTTDEIATPEFETRFVALKAANDSRMSVDDP